MAPYTPNDAAQGIAALSIDGSKHILDALKQALASKDDKQTAAAKVAELVRDAKELNLEAFAAQVDAALVDKSIDARLSSCFIVSEIVKACGVKTEAYFAPLLENLLIAYADKNKDVRAEAQVASEALLKASSPDAVKIYLPMLFGAFTREKKWQTKKAGLDLVGLLATKNPYQIGRCLPDIIPQVSHVMWDTKKDVKVAAKKCMESICGVVGNDDLTPFIPNLISAIANPKEVPECTHKLASTTFVRAVEAPALAIMEPLLSRALEQSSKAAIKRQAAVIIDNMCKLMDDPAEAQLFMPKLLPALQKCIDTLPDPEARGKSEQAYKTLFRAGGEVEVSEDELKVEFSSILDALNKVIKENGAEGKYTEAVRNYVAGQGLLMVETRRYLLSIWKDAMTPFIDNEAVIKAFMDLCHLENKPKVAADLVPEEEGVDLCDCEFSLAYGGMILLNNAHLKLKRGKRYGLCGPNGCGKSTLMRAIANGQVDGFPDKNELKTIYVEHNLQESEAELSIVDFILADPELSGKTREEVENNLREVGFSEAMLIQAVGSLSGGWKMKLELARAMLLEADILLLDEPTNHLDVVNVAWLENYLTSQTQITSLIVSHDSGFLDNVCTNIIHYETRKLKTYIGNLSEFVKQKPEARAYYELEAAAFKFTFPEPGFLADIKNKGKPIVRLTDCTFTYPGAPKPSMNHATVTAALSSRIGVVGPNGAGKSTLIKMLTGEVEPSSGTMWKHPAMRFAYVAQHAFHHIEQHLDMTANQYVQWRFQSGEDKELLAKETRKLSDEEKARLKKPISWEGEKYVIEEFKNRRKLKKSFEYEIKFVNVPDTETAWIPREKLEKWGFEKLIQIADDREAARANLQAKPCTTGVIQTHFEDFGLDPEFSTHNRMRGLSGGQKVKVVLGAAMWQNPHILVLDEPTNFLDRDSLGALSGAIKDFGGGVVVISHNAQFVRETTKEIWNVNDFWLQIEGQQAMDMTKIEQKTEEEMTDAFGNVHKTKIKKALTRKELKAKMKAKKAAEKRA